MKRVLFAALFALGSTSASASVFDLNISDDSFRVAVAGQLSSLFEVNKGQFDLGLLSKRGDGNEGDLTQGHFGVLLTGDAGAQKADVVAGLGVRFMGAEFESPTAGDVTGGAIALGGQVEFRVPQFNRLGAVVAAYGAPSATSLSDIDRYTEINASIDYQVIRDASIYVGYRNVRYTIELQGGNSRDLTADTGFHAGLRLNF